MSAELRYALVSPVRDEASNLPRLAECLAAQTAGPTAWVIVDNGSTDETREIARGLAEAHSWVTFLELPGERTPTRGATIVRAFLAGVDALPEIPEIVVKLDADLSMESDYFRRLLDAFEADAALGIASGICLEEVDGEWRLQHVTRNHVRGAARAYRRECLRDVQPLVEGLGWDGVDELKAQTRGWVVRSLPDLELRHHRALGMRDRRVAKWVDQGDMAYFMSYRPSYLLARTAYRAVADPSALAMVYGYVRALARRGPRYEDQMVRRLLREQQSLRQLPSRIREALGRT
jgi:glycosyltransferase involved in cell wall biosynthesis